MSQILYASGDGVAMLTLNRPTTLNAFNDEMIGESTDLLARARDDSAVRCIVITGAGRGFSSGQDLSDVQSRSADFNIGQHLRHGYHRLVKQIIRMDKPVIAAVNGIAAGAGAGIAMACDYRIAADNAAFMLAFTKIGLIPDSAINWVLPRMIGYARAYEMALTADKIPAEKALAWGMVNQVVPAAEFTLAVNTFATRIASGATLAYGLAKRAMWDGFDQSLDAALETEAELQTKAANTQDFKEGVTAFLEKRPARFTGT